MSATLHTTLRTGRWQLVSSLTSACFAVRNFGVKTVWGQFPVRAACIDVDETGRPCAVYAELDVDGVATGNARRDRDLRKPHLLDTATYPSMSFAGGPAERVDATQWVVPGLLTARGRSMELTLHVDTTVTEGGKIAVRALTELDRRTFGVTAPRFLIGRRIRVQVAAAFLPPD